MAVLYIVTIQILINEKASCIPSTCQTPGRVCFVWETTSQGPYRCRFLSGLHSEKRDPASQIRTAKKSTKLISNFHQTKSINRIILQVQTSPEIPPVRKFCVMGCTSDRPVTSTAIKSSATTKSHPKHHQKLEITSETNEADSSTEYHRPTSIWNHPSDTGRDTGALFRRQS